MPRTCCRRPLGQPQERTRSPRTAAGRHRPCAVRARLESKHARTHARTHAHPHAHAQAHTARKLENYAHTRLPALARNPLYTHTGRVFPEGGRGIQPLQPPGQNRGLLTARDEMSPHDARTHARTHARAHVHGLAGMHARAHKQAQNGRTVVSAGQVTATRQAAEQTAALSAA